LSARLLATFCLVLCSISVCRSQSAGSTDPDVVVYLKGDATQPAVPLAQMKREASALLRTAGYHVEWRSLDAGPHEAAPQIAVVELNGTCGMPPGSVPRLDPPPNGASLANTTVTDGQVLPFSTVNCATLTRSLASLLVREAGAHRDFLYGRAMGRVIAHEIYHILMRTTEHSRSGVARSCFTLDDLVTERFEFEASTLAQLRRKPDNVSAGTIGEDASDR
jgi:hypothetical protein